MSQFSACDEYGFVRGKDFDAVAYDEFRSTYLRTLSHRAMKWESVLTKGGYSKLDRGSKIKRYVRKGIPSAHRKNVWLHLSGAAQLRREEPDHYQAMLAVETKKDVLDQIITDIPRTFPNDSHFDRTNPNSLQPQLTNVLKAFANSSPKIGYCQGLNYIAGLLVLITKDEDASFWLLKVLCETILPEYYSPGMPGLLTDIKVLAEIARLQVPRLANHVDRVQMPWALVASKWFICLYAEVLPIETVLRIWDCLFLEGNKVLFRVALVLLKVHEDFLMSKNDFSELANAFKDICQNGVTLDCHTFLEGMYAVPRTRHSQVMAPVLSKLTRARLGKLRQNFGSQVRLEQIEREKRREKDGSQRLRDG